MRLALESYLELWDRKTTSLDLDQLPREPRYNNQLHSYHHHNLRTYLVSYSSREEPRRDGGYLTEGR